MEKNLQSTGANGTTYTGKVLVRQRQVMKPYKNELTKEKEVRRVVVYDVESSVNGKPFGFVAKNLEDSKMVDIETAKQEAYVQLHLEKMAKRAGTKADVTVSLENRGFTTPTKAKPKVFQSAAAGKINNVEEWIKKHTKRVGMTEDLLGQVATA